MASNPPFHLGFPGMLPPLDPQIPPGLSWVPLITTLSSPVWIPGPHLDLHGTQNCQPIQNDSILRNASPALPSPQPLPCLALTLILGARVCTNMQLLSLSSLSSLPLCLLKSAIYSESCITAQFTEADTLCYPTTIVVSSQITNYMVGCSEVTSLHNPSPALLYPARTSPYLYFPISQPIQLGSYKTLNLSSCSTYQ